MVVCGQYITVLIFAVWFFRVSGKGCKTDEQEQVNKKAGSA